MRALVVLVLLCACAGREDGLSASVEVQVEGFPPDSGFTHAALAVESVQLTPCVSWWHTFSPVSTAWAHETGPVSDPRTVVAPLVIDLLSEGPQPLTVFAPPPGSVCGLTLGLAPSTGQTRAKGTTLLLEGAAFEVSTTQRSVPLAVTPVTLDADHRAVSWRVHLQWHGRQPSGDDTIDALGWSVE